jgi:hypothetical protein
VVLASSERCRRELLKARQAAERRQRAEGRAFSRQLRRSFESRDAALASVKMVVPGWWAVKIGGPIRGAWTTFPTHRDAVDAVHKHYNAALLRWVQRRWSKP